MTSSSIRLEGGCSAMTVCFNLKPNYTAFVFPNGARQHRLYWMNDYDILHDLKREIAYLIDPHAQAILSSLTGESETETITTTATTMTKTTSMTTTACPTYDLFDQLKYSYMTYLILFYMILLLLGVGLILFLQIRYIHRYFYAYNRYPRVNLSSI